MRLDPGQVFYVTEGEHSDFGVVGIYRCRVAFEPEGMSVRDIESYADEIDAPELWLGSLGGVVKGK